MPTSRHRSLHPLNLAGLATLFAISLSLRWVPAADVVLAWSLLGAFVIAFIGQDLCKPGYPRLALALLLLQPLLALLLIWLTPKIGTAQILLVIWTAVIASVWPPRIALAAVLAADVVVYLVLRKGGHDSPLTVTMLYAGFQAFAAMCAYYAHSAEAARDRLALVNADLLATRALLADAARDAERLRVARELHDVAGHKLTAMTLNLRALAADPALTGRRELIVAQQMAAELMGDIRSVVQALRDSRGLDLATALHALAAPLPRPALQLQIADDVHVSDPCVAEAVLRLVQEALTNSARHSDAVTVHVDLQRDGRQLRVAIEDDGRVRGPVLEGNGLSGMRERIAFADGTLALSITARGAMRIDASLPL